jgi:hypothetical protein
MLREWAQTALDAARVLAEAEARPTWEEIRKLPTPWKPDLSGFMFCDWCAAKVEMPYFEDRERMEMGYQVQPHPNNGCLWARAHAEARAEPDGEQET